jgi:hypothetical protein
MIDTTTEGTMSELGQRVRNILSRETGTVVEVRRETVVVAADDEYVLDPHDTGVREWSRDEVEVIRP